MTTISCGSGSSACSSASAHDGVLGLARRLAASTARCRCRRSPHRIGDGRPCGHSATRQRSTATVDERRERVGSRAQPRHQSVPLDAVEPALALGGTSAHRRAAAPNDAHVPRRQRAASRRPTPRTRSAGPTAAVSTTPSHSGTRDATAAASGSRRASRTWARGGDVGGVDAVAVGSCNGAASPPQFVGGGRRRAARARRRRRGARPQRG